MGSNDGGKNIDWREEALRWQQEASAIRSLVEELRAELETLRAENAALRARNAELEAEVTGLRRHNEELLRRVLGPKSEKMPPIDDELRKRKGKGKGEGDGRSGTERRRKNAEVRASLDTEEVEHPVPREERTCPNCAGVPLRPMPPERSVQFEYIPARLVRLEHLREKLSCPRSCGFIVTADAPTRVYDKARYGPNLLAHVVTAKCADVLPINRQAKQLTRLGIPMARSTLNELFHRAAELLEPVVVRMQELVAQSSLVLADETSFRIQHPGACRRGFIWTFIGAGLVLYRYCANRSGETPQRVLGGTTGTLLVDGYTGYNHVCDVAGRERAGCLCHFRRYFFDALSTAPEAATHVLEVVVEIYKIERHAAKAGIVGTDAHLQLRQAETKPLMDELKTWLEEQKPWHPPKSPIGRAVGYGLNQWDALTRFLSDPTLPPDNNESERRLRIVALGRHNYLFAGHDTGAANLATLMSLVTTCESHGIDPQAYLADVLIRIQTHPQSRIDDLVPPRWKLMQEVGWNTDSDQLLDEPSLAA